MIAGAHDAVRRRDGGPHGAEVATRAPRGANDVMIDGPAYPSATGLRPTRDLARAAQHGGVHHPAVHQRRAGHGVVRGQDAPGPGHLLGRGGEDLRRHGHLRRVDAERAHEAERAPCDHVGAEPARSRVSPMVEG